MSWTKVTKATGSTWSSVASLPGVHSGEITGNPIGLLLSLTYTIAGTQWTDITKASGTSWTKITKAL